MSTDTQAATQLRNEAANLQRKSDSKGKRVKRNLAAVLKRNKAAKVNSNKHIKEIRQQK